MKRVKLQEIADMLEVSRVTVWKVFNNKEGVSEETRRRVLDCAAVMQYEPLKSQDISVIIPEKQRILVSVVVSRPDTSAFWIEIIHALSQELSNEGIGLMYTYLPEQVNDDYILPDTLTDKNLHGIIIMNVYDNKMLKRLNDLPIPKVFLDVVTDMEDVGLKGDLILLEGRKSVKEIVTYLLKKGRTRIGFIGDIHYAKTNMERYEGYLLALKEFDLELDSLLCYTNNMSLFAYTQVIEEFLEGFSIMPEAFICVNDHIASILLQSLQRRGYNVPKDVAVSGFDDNNEFNSTKSLTTVRVNNSLLGKRLVKQLLYRMENGEEHYETTYIRPKVIYRSTTEI